jgi:hypothetical protein
VVDACRSLDLSGTDLASDLTIALPWAHPDIGVPDGETIASRPEGFSLGLAAVDPFDEPIRLVDSEAGEVIVPGAGSSFLEKSFGAALSFVPRAGEERRAPGSIYDADIRESLVSVGAVAVAAWTFSPSSPIADVGLPCVSSDLPPDCVTRSFEGTIVSLPAERSFVVVSSPAELAYDTCEDRMVVDGVPFFGVSSIGSTDFRMTPTADILASDAPDPVRGFEAPGFVAAGTDASVSFSAAGGAYQAVPRVPSTRAECDPEPGPDCIRRCRTTIDLTGTIIEASASVRVFSGHTCGRLIEGDPCSYHAEELFTEGEGSYVVPGPASFEDRVRVRIVPVAADADVMVLGTTVRLSARESLEVDLPSDTMVSASEPVLIARISRRAVENGASAITMIAPPDRFALEHVVPSMRHSRVIVTAERGGEVRVGGVARAPISRIDRYEVYEVEVEESDELTRIESSNRATVLFAVVPPESRSFAITRGARSAWRPR